MSDNTKIPDKGKRRSESPVCSHNEWDPLEEVIVGVIDNAHVPEWHITLEATMPSRHWDFFKANGGKPWPADKLELARRELEELVHVLEAEGVTVRRPDVLDFSKPYSTLDWRSASGMYAAMPRDVLLVVGDEIIEAPMSWRSRYYEPNAYRRLIKDYFRRGARWTAAPKPELTDTLYDSGWEDPGYGYEGPQRLLLTEFEPVFDAADFFRCGRDIFVQQSNVTNAFGIEWMRRHLGDGYRVHEVKVRDSHPMHIDATLVPLAPGKLLVNPERVIEVPEMFEKWDILVAPKPAIGDDHALYMTSKWVNMNVISLDEKRVVVEAQDEPMIAALKKWGFTPVKCNFRNVNTFGGSFHCTTADVRRRGVLQSYF